MKRKLPWLTFGLYCAVMLWLLFGQRLGGIRYGDYLQQLRENVNLMPLDTVSRFLWALQNAGQPGIRTHAFINLVGNVVMFVPAGVLLPSLWRKLRVFWPFLLSAALTILGVELVQLVTLLGKLDVDDFLLNLIGVLAGWCLWRILTKRTEN